MAKVPPVLNEYFEYQKKYSNIYDPEYTVVLMQIGGFYEIYSTDTEGVDIQKVSSLLDINLGRKNGTTASTVTAVSKNNPYMSGFPIGAINKHRRKLVNAGWTVIVIDQVTPLPNVTREVAGVFSPGTSMDDITPDSNNIVSLYITDDTDYISAGLSTFDLSTGKGIVYEAYSTKYDSNLAMDTMSKWLLNYNPKEIVIYSDCKHNSIDKFVVFLELEKKVYHVKKTIPKEFTKIKFQNDYLSKIWTKNGNMTCLEYLGLEKMQNATVSLIVLLEFAIQHNEKITLNLPLPEIYQDDTRLVLGNSAPIQLNILDNSLLETNRLRGKKMYKNLFDVIDKTSTSIGKRALRDLVLNPYIEVKQIARLYEYVDELKNDFTLYTDIELQLNNITDIERLQRKISMCTLTPMDFVRLNSSYIAIANIMKTLADNEVLEKLCDKTTQSKLKKYMKEYDDIIDIEEASKYSLVNMIGSFFKEGYDTKVDDINETIVESKSFLEATRDVLSECIESKHPIKLDYSETQGYTLKMTKKQADDLKSAIKSKKIQIQDYTLDSKDIHYNDRSKEKKVHTKNGPENQMKGVNKITFDKFTEVAETLCEEQRRISTVLNKLWVRTLKKWFETYKSLYNELVLFVAQIDIIKSNAKVAKDYNYAKPKIVDGKKGYIDIKDMRHPIIERLCTDTAYIPHDIVLGEEYDGMLLFGLNSSGKSSIMKAIGLIVVMMQCGMFVPCTKVTFSPYKALYARITSHDNIFKGQSSFSLEMVELKSILKRADEKTLVIGDEVCRGTESTSGASIVATTVDFLAQKRTSFVFTTHLHMIADLKRIKELTNVRMFHLTVMIDSKNDCLVFDRKLKPGTGPSVYGLTVAKYILDNKDFIDTSYSFMNEILKTDTDIRTSKYNRDLYVNKCQICGFGMTKYLDTHHINFQSKCKDGYSKEHPHIGKNAKCNLVILCKACHINTHLGLYEIRRWIETTNGRVLEYIKHDNYKQLQSNS